MLLTLTHLNHVMDTMLLDLVANGYAQSTTKWKVPCVLKKIKGLAGCKSYSSYEEILEDFNTHEYLRSPELSRNAIWIIGMLKFYDAHGKLPYGKSSNLGFHNKKPLLFEEFQSVLHTYENNERKRLIKDSTIKTSLKNGRSFFWSLQALGVHTLNDITIASVVQVFKGNESRPCKCATFRKSLVWIFRANFEHLGKDLCERIINYFPQVGSARKNIQFLTVEECQCIRKALLSQDSSLSKRDRAVGILAFSTGLRSCDIAKLEFKDIDWNNETLTVSQQKTNVQVLLPLLPNVGNAIFNYITHERESSESVSIFLKKSLCKLPITSEDCYSISKRIMKEAEVRQKIGDRKGLHLFRHKIATSMLSSNIPLPVISKALGHQSPKSTEAYLGSDCHHLKLCALSIEKYPIEKGVLS